MAIAYAIPTLVPVSRHLAIVQRSCMKRSIYDPTKVSMNRT